MNRSKNRSRTRNSNKENEIAVKGKHIDTDSENERSNKVIEESNRRASGRHRRRSHRSNSRGFLHFAVIESNFLGFQLFFLIQVQIKNFMPKTTILINPTVQDHTNRIEKGKLYLIEAIIGII